MIQNEIPAEVYGEISNVLVNDGDGVEYNQPLFLVRRPHLRVANPEPP